MMLRSKGRAGMSAGTHPRHLIPPARRFQPSTFTPTPLKPPLRTPTHHSPVQKMVFFQKAGAMNSDVPVLGQDFNTWFPLTMVIYVALLSLNWWERCCSKIFIANRFRFEAVSAGAGGSGGPASVAAEYRRRRQGGGPPTGPAGQGDPHRRRHAGRGAPCCLGASMAMQGASTGLTRHPVTSPTPMPGWRPSSLQERADDEHTTRGMRLVQAEVDAISKGWPLGDGIGLFGVGSSRNGLPGTRGASSKQQGPALESSVELNASSSALSAPPPASATRRQPLFGGASSGGGGAASSSASSHAAAMREKYGRGGSSSAAAAAAAGPAGAVSAGSSSAPRRLDDDLDDGGMVDALFAGVESRPARHTGAQRLLDQPADSSSSSYAMPFGWKRGR